jgi:hypothetical protein
LQQSRIRPQAKISRYHNFQSQLLIFVGGDSSCWCDNSDDLHERGQPRQPITVLIAVMNLPTCSTEIGTSTMLYRLRRFSCVVNSDLDRLKL